ncbi:transglycosylase SLT domain-containing protein [Desulfococcaceae bacterium HSG8]|nr:transglycosylase SLT domain-containing protein [Desulfococcaceae bacterium HSG8]
MNPLILRNIFLFFCLMLMTGLPARSESLTPSQYPSLISCLRQNDPLYFCNEKVPLKNQEVRERFEKELLLTLWDRAQVILWLKRAGRYMPYIEKMLKQNRLPDDLKYVPIIESALQPHAGSSKGAMGFWQFMRSTGQNYGLIVDSETDGRRNIFKSTGAAMLYLEYLYEKFGSWTLAAAAYNMGENRLETEITVQETDDYYQLYLSQETQRYILKLISVKLILSDPGKYGFSMIRSDKYPQLQFDRVQVEIFRETPVRLIARAAKTYFKVIKDLNPEIRGYYLHPGNHEILIPKGASRKFRKRYNKLFNQWIKDTEKNVYEVQQGDNLTFIAESFDVPLGALLIWNRLDFNHTIHPGDRLIVHPGNRTRE